MSEMVVNFFVQNSIGGLILNCKTLVAHLQMHEKSRLCDVLPPLAQELKTLMHVSIYHE